MGINDRQFVPLVSHYSNPIYTFKNPYHQNFPFRRPIMKYILKNPTGKAWKNLIKTCKYFFSQYPIYPVESLKNMSCWEADKEKFDSNKNFPKLWLFDTLYCWNQFLEPNIVSELIPKIFKFDLYSLLIYDQALTWDAYEILTSSGSIKKMTVLKCLFKYSDGKDITMDKLLGNLQKCQNFVFIPDRNSRNFKKDTVQKMGKILSGFKDLRNFQLSSLDETFDLVSFMDFLMTNKVISVNICHGENLQFSSAQTQMLENCFRKLVTNPPEKIPKICVPGFDGVEYREYCKTYN